jgi:hypothetical protein
MGVSSTGIERLFESIELGVDRSGSDDFTGSDIGSRLSYVASH